MHTFTKILVANRGEIAIRIIRAAGSLGIHSMAVYSRQDGPDSFHCRMADECFSLEGANLQDTYLNIGKIIRIARDTGADAIHPGYGFLSENHRFAAACEDHGISFIGPPSRILRLLGNKAKAREIVKEMGIPVIDGKAASPDDVPGGSDGLSYPVLVKAAAGGGGKGIRIVNNKHELKAAIETASREANNYFGDGSIYLEKYLDPARHVEFQILGDRHGNIIHLYERECSVQRRYQKIIEESPSTFLKPGTRKAMGKAAVGIARKLGYQNAGAIEFLLDRDQNFYFIEMNTRIQVEHAVTEMTTGIDLVREQIRIAMGYPIGLKQEDVKPGGHAIEARIYAENPAKNFRPAPGRILYYNEPSGKGVRVDACTDGPCRIWQQYDPMISKLVVHGRNRAEAIGRLNEALQAYSIVGIDTNMMLLREIVNHRDFIDNHISTRYFEDHLDELRDRMKSAQISVPGDLFRTGFLAATLARGPVPEDPSSPFRAIGYWRQINKLYYRHEHQEESVCIISMQNRRLAYRFEQTVFEAVDIDYNPGLIHFTYKGSRIKMHHVVMESGEEIIDYKGIQQRFTRFDSLPDAPVVNDSSAENETKDRVIVSPMYGKITSINVKEKDSVRKGDLLFTIDSMKIENNVLAPRNGTISKIVVQAGQQIEVDKPVLVID